MASTPLLVFPSMASSAAAAASGLRHHLSRTVSQPLLSFPLYRRRRRCHHSLAHRASFSLLGTLRFVRPCPHSLSAARPRRFLSAPASASPLAARALSSPQKAPIEEDDLEYDEEDREVQEVLEVSPSGGEENEGGEDDDGGEEGRDVHGRVEELESELVVAEQQQLPRFPSPKLSVKEKKELAAYAHSLGKKLKSQQVGKSGVTPSVVAAFVETLEVNELLKLKVHGSCPGELPNVIKLLEETTGSVAVGQIGRSVILYRPSLSKMKKNEAPTVKRTWRPKHKEPDSGLRLQKKRPTQRSSGPRINNIANKI